jgi:hypothetical protein
MIKTTIGLFAIVLCFACKQKTETASTITVANSTSTITITAPKVFENLLGSFVGIFGDNKITMLITKAMGDSIAGRTVVGGNDRPFAGTIAFANGVYNIIANEPGNDKNDGSFNFTVKEANPKIVEGTWVPYNKSSKARNYVLQKKAFEYKIDVGMYPESSQRILKEEDVSNYSKGELELMRNAIFARHGYCFKKKELRQAFEKEEWYVPNTVNVVDELTAIEKKNITLIKRYEQYATEYGDDFGR